MKIEKKRYKGLDEWKFLFCKNSVKGLNGTSVVMPEGSCRASRSLGFTLVELVIVIAIVIVLSVVSVPIYRSYVDKAKMAEGYALLGTILSAQKAYYSEYGYFVRNKDVNFTNFEPNLGIDARGNKYFTWFRFQKGTKEEAMYMCGAGIVKPEELGGYSWLAMYYNITSGVTQGDYGSW